LILGEWDLNLYGDLGRFIRDHRRNHFNFCASDGEDVEHSIGGSSGFSGRTAWDDDVSCRFIRHVFSILLQHAGAEELKTREDHGDENNH
jgi:hypothetical protein